MQPRRHRQEPWVGRANACCGPVLRILARPIQWQSAPDLWAALPGSIGHPKRGRNQETEKADSRRPGKESNAPRETERPEASCRPAQGSPNDSFAERQSSWVAGVEAGRCVATSDYFRMYNALSRILPIFG